MSDAEILLTPPIRISKGGVCCPCEHRWSICAIMLCYCSLSYSKQSPPCVAYALRPNNTWATQVSHTQRHVSSRQAPIRVADEFCKLFLSAFNPGL